MKLPIISIGIALFSGTMTLISADTPFSITERGPNHRVWTRTVEETLRNGKKINRVHSYTELAGGMNAWSDELKDWVEASDEIEIINGYAVARRGQTKVLWAPNPNSAGAVDVQTLDGKRFRSHVLGLAFTDTRTGASFFIATPQDCLGEVAGNQVIYRNAFDGINADIVYSYSKLGLEQDIVLREDLPDPSQAPWNLNPDTVHLEIYTEFIDPPEPNKTVAVLKRETDPGKRPFLLEPDLLDEQLHFGATLIGGGTAFPLDASEDRIPIAKSFERRDGNRQCLIEKVEYHTIKQKLNALPRAAVITKERVAALEKRIIRDPRGVRRTPLLEAPAMAARNTQKAMRMAAAAGPNKIEVAQTDPRRGFVLDYAQISTMSNALLRCDTTYYVSGIVNLSGMTTFEGGVVIKYAPTNSATLQLSGPVTCYTGPYRVVTCTARDDTSIGEAIGASSLSGYYASIAIDLKGANARDLKYFRISHANTAVAVESDAGPGQTFSHFQIVNCRNGLNPINTTYALRNALMYRVLTNFVTSSSNTTGALEHVTINLADRLNASGGAQLQWLYPTNCLFVSVTNYGFSYVTNSSAVVSNLAAGSACFQTVGAGANYLTNNSVHRDVGTTNINPTLAGELKLKTTYPPTIYTNTISTNTTFAPLAGRDTDIPDLGFHYDPIDYAFNALSVNNNSTLSLASGTVLAKYGNSDGLRVFGASLEAAGSPTNFVRLLAYNTSQEEANSNWCATSSAYLLSVGYGAPTQISQFRFSEISAPPGNYRLMISVPDGPFGFSARDLQFRGGRVDVYGSGGGGFAYLTNCLFERVTSLISEDEENIDFRVYNNTFYGGSVDFEHSGAGSWILRNNLFDKAAVTCDFTFDADYSGYVTNGGQICSFPGGHDLIQTSSTNISYQTGWLGRFYLPTNSVFVNKGNTNANLLGFYHYTCTTNQVKETNSVVDIGFHYIAVDANGIPVDADGDSLPDYREDSNGNGSFDSGETSWLVADTDYDGRTDGQELADGTDALNGSSVTNILLGYWRFNTNTWIGEQGQLPKFSSNLFSILSWNGNAVLIDTNPVARLEYNDVEANLAANVNCRNGSVRFWYRPDWNSSTTNSGTGPGSDGRLLEVGSRSSPATNGWWSLLISTNGTQFAFRTQTNGSALTNLTATINWTSNDWHQVILTYSPSNSSLYVDGQPVNTNGVGVSYFPNLTERSVDAFRIGSNKAGSEQVKGLFDELRTFNYPLSAAQVINEYNFDSDGDGAIDLRDIQSNDPSVRELTITIERPPANSVIY